jgi:hypothetical protein
MESEGLAATIGDGDFRRSLEAIRDKLAVELAAAEGRDAAPLAKELRAVIAQLEALPGGREGSKSDDLAAKRAARRAAPRRAKAAGS